MFKIKYFESERKYVQVLVDIKEYEIGDLIQIKVFNYEKFINVFIVFIEENFEETENCEDCKYEGYAERMAHTIRHVF